MTLFTKEIKEKLLKAKYSSTTPICKLFNPAGAGTWLICSMTAEEVITGTDAYGKDIIEEDYIMQAFCDLGMDCVEFGGVSLNELKTVRLPFGLKIERDRHWKYDGKTDYFGRSSLSGV